MNNDFLVLVIGAMIFLSFSLLLASLLSGILGLSLLILAVVTLLTEKENVESEEIKTNEGPK